MEIATDIRCLEDELAATGVNIDEEHSKLPPIGMARSRAFTQHAQQ
jgi:hypothetical protein